MIYTDENHREWWKSLTALEKEELFQKMEDLSENPDFAISLRAWWNTKKWLSPKQIAAIRKWAD